MSRPTTTRVPGIFIAALASRMPSVDKTKCCEDDQKCCSSPKCESGKHHKHCEAKARARARGQVALIEGSRPPLRVVGLRHLTWLLVQQEGRQVLMRGSLGESSPSGCGAPINARGCGCVRTTRVIARAASNAAGERTNEKALRLRLKPAVKGKADAVQSHAYRSAKA